MSRPFPRRPPIEHRRALVTPLLGHPLSDTPPDSSRVTSHHSRLFGQSLRHRHGVCQPAIWLCRSRANDFRRPRPSVHHNTADPFVQEAFVEQVREVGETLCYQQPSCPVPLHVVLSGDNQVRKCRSCSNALPPVRKSQFRIIHRLNHPIVPVRSHTLVVVRYRRHRPGRSERAARRTSR